MVPTTLDEAIVALDAILCQEDKDYLHNATDPEEAATFLHPSLGRHLRNEWDLWGDPPLAQHLKNLGIDHPDDMSHQVIVAYCRNVRSRFEREEPL
jgi:hypothetical protein